MLRKLFVQYLSQAREACLVLIHADQHALFSAAQNPGYLPHVLRQGVRYVLPRYKWRTWLSATSFAPTARSVILLWRVHAWMGGSRAAELACLLLFEHDVGERANEGSLTTDSPYLPKMRVKGHLQRVALTLTRERHTCTIG